MSLSITTKELIKEIPLLGSEFSLPPNSNNSILVTGGAGFLGIHLLKFLSESKKYKSIYTIVRNKDKLLKQAQYFDLGTDWIKNINIIEGDLLLLENELFPEVEYIIHSAAEIHCLKNKGKLWKNNVSVTNRMAQIYRNNHFIFISTLSVFVSSNQLGTHHNNPIDISDEHSLYGGYAQTKFIGEKIVESINGKIIRLGLITGASDKGIFPNDFFTSFVKLLKKIKAYPEDYEMSYVDITPVDYAVLSIIKHIHSEEKIIHVANKESASINDFVSILNLEKVSRSEWLDLITNEGTLNQYLLKYAFFKNEMLDKHFEYFNLDLFQSTGHDYSIKKSFPLDNRTMLKLYFDEITNRNNYEI